MNKIDLLFIIILFIIIGIYIYILAKNNLLFNKEKTENKKITSTILNKTNSWIFEIFEIIVLIIITYILYKQKQYILSFVFIIETLEHINQIIFCYRQNLDSLQIITIILDIFFLIYAYYKNCYWIIPFFIIGILIHIISIYYKKSFTNIVCINDILEK